jgi:hypothetical protein
VKEHERAGLGSGWGTSAAFRFEGVRRSFPNLRLRMLVQVSLLESVMVDQCAI